jgi:hypothetical protein
MATILTFKPALPFTVCPRCDGSGVEATVLNPFTQQSQPLACGKCEATGRFTVLMEAEGNVRYWRSLVESLSRVGVRAPKKLRDARESLEFWTNKAAMYAAMKEAR